RGRVNRCPAPGCGNKRYRPASHMNKLHCGHRCAHCDPLSRFNRRMARWGIKNVEAAKRAAAALEEDLKRGRGAAPKKEQLHTRWRVMFESDGDGELSLMERYRMVALLDWQQHPEDWPRDKWPSSRSDLDDLPEPLLSGAAARIKKALQRAGTKPSVP